MKKDSQPFREIIADRMQASADKDTFFRSDTATTLGSLIENTDPEWDVTDATIRILLSDMTDGFWARGAKKVRGYDKPTAGAAEDPAADHKIIDEILSGLILRAYRRDDFDTSLNLSQIQFRSRRRNALMDDNRQRIQRSSLDQRELRASALNKFKFLGQAIGCVILTTPATKHAIVDRTGKAILKLGTKCGDVGEKQFKKKIDNRLSD